MDDYRTKRRYRRQKLERSGFYHQRRQRSRARRQAAAGNTAATTIPAMEQIFSQENLIRCYYNLQQRGGHAPGPDGIRYPDLGHREICQIMRDLSVNILSGRFMPSKARSIRIPKASGGHRTLKLRSIVYRIVAAALADALGPYFDGLFLPESHGFRHGRGVGTMLLHMERIILEQDRLVIAQDDIRNAFDHVPINYLSKLLGGHIHDERILTIANQILRGHREEPRTVGIDQGSPLSPLMLNVALHHTLDKSLSDNAVSPPWLRYADNLVFLGRSVYEGEAAIQAAQERLEPIGMSLKGKDGPAADLQKGQRANILGFQIRWDHGQIKYDLAEEAWDNLGNTLSATHPHANPEWATQAIKGWMEAGGPAFEGKVEAPILNRVQEVAAAAGQRELPRSQLKRYLQSARDRWAERRQQPAKAHSISIGDQDRRNEAAPLATDRTGHLSMPEAGSPQAQPAAVSAPF